MILRERDLDVNVLSTARGHLRTKKEKGGRGVGVGGSRAVAVAGGRLINFSYLKPYSPLTKKKRRKKKKRERNGDLYVGYLLQLCIFDFYNLIIHRS